MPIKLLINKLYKQDYALWLETTIEQLNSRDFSELDLENLLEELEDLGRSDKRALKSLLTRLLEHLLKFVYWHSEREYCQNSWRAEIRTFRIQIKDLLKESPSLNTYLVNIFDQCYNNARAVILDLTGLSASVISENNFISLEKVLDEDWFPIY